MLDESFGLIHLLILFFVAVIIVGLPLLLVFILARWLDQRAQSRPNVKVSFVAVLIGGLTDVVSSSIFAIPVVIYAMVKYDLLHAPNNSALIASSIHSSAWLYGLQLTIGMGCSVLGGYVAARIAKHDELLNGLLSSFLCITFGIYPLLLNKDSHSVLKQISFLLISPACALLGGYLRQMQKAMGARLDANLG